MIHSMTADQLLAVPLAEPERIFTRGQLDVIKREYKVLAMKWHPDRSSDPLANDVTAHLAALKKKAVEKVRGGLWEEPGVITVQSTEGKTFKIRFIAKGDFELGKYYIGHEVVAYFVERSFKNLFDNAKQMISGLKYRSKGMEKEVSRYVPEILKTFTATDGRHVMVIKKTKDLIRLKDLLKHQKGNIDPRHAAWIMSSLHNLMCYFHIEGIAHNDISLETYFVSPFYHRGALLGGWWYARESGEKLLSVPKRSYNIMSPKQKDSKNASRVLNLQLIRAIGLEILGDPVGVKLAKEGRVPAAFVNWLRHPPTKDAIEDYSTWQNKVLIESFGERKFVEFKVSANDVYGLR